ncbi:MAG: C39 family peptidase [Chloroflexi bacterium]|nr:C39 family peptidase [Chloroflexota bacterium]MBP8059354.1 C39 family peptidase [Chloroflexota bacterium]
MPPPLPVPFHPQKANGYCLAACAQMVLHFWGIAADQERLAQLLGVEPEVGAPAGRISRLKSYDVTIIYESGEWDTVTAWLAQNVPVIAAIQAGELPYWQGEYFQHAVVVGGYDETHLWLLDPATGSEPILVPIDEFMLAWGEMDYRYAVIQPNSH